jgi:hypothetical protein
MAANFAKLPDCCGGRSVADDEAARGIMEAHPNGCRSNVNIIGVPLAV